MKELKPIEESWNKKRIFLGVTILVILIAGLTAFKVLVLNKTQDLSQNSPLARLKAVQGASTQVNPLVQNNGVQNLKNNIQDQINTIKQEAASINLTDIATSSPQVKKIIEDIKSIQNLPRNQAKGLCEQICSGL